MRRTFSFETFSNIGINCFKLVSLNRLWPGFNINPFDTSCASNDERMVFFVNLRRISLISNKDYCKHLHQSYSLKHKYFIVTDRCDVSNGYFVRIKLYITLLVFCIILCLYNFCYSTGFLYL